MAGSSTTAKLTRSTTVTGACSDGRSHWHYVNVIVATITIIIILIIIITITTITITTITITISGRPLEHHQ